MLNKDTKVKRGFYCLDPEENKRRQKERFLARRRKYRREYWKKKESAIKKAEIRQEFVDLGLDPNGLRDHKREVIIIK